MWCQLCWRNAGYCTGVVKENTSLHVQCCSFVQKIDYAFKKGECKGENDYIDECRETEG